VSRNLTLILALLFFSSCGAKKIHEGVKTPLKMVQLGADPTYNKDDFYFLAALDAKYLGDSQASAKYFEKLYYDTKNVDFAYEAIRSYAKIKDFDKVKQIIKTALQNHPDDLNLKRYSAAFYIDTKDYEKAHLILKTLPRSSDPNIQNADETLKATVELGLGNTQKALEYFRSKYQKSKSSRDAIVLSDLLYSDGKIDEAIKVLKNHTDFVECNEQICARLITYYKDKNQVEPIISLTKKLYKKTHKSSYAAMLIKLYQYVDDKDRAIEFLKDSHFDDKLLLQLYIAKKDYAHAKNLAQKLYNESGDLDMLAQLLMAEYEGSKKRDKSFMKSFSKKFDKVVEKIDDPIYNNFYGYILIDEDFNIPKGIELVKKALKKEPDAPFFIDSLAWGYYKRGECKKALETIEPIVEGAKAKEIKDHYKKIRECQ